jgi:ABC-type Mn2+/Zn2+ transport system permease subunit
MRGLSRYGTFKTQPWTWESSLPPLIGGGTALLGTAAVRGFAPAGSGWSRHAGALGGVFGAAVAGVAKQGYGAIATALLTGLGVEAIQYLTEWKLTRGVG